MEMHFTIKIRSGICTCTVSNPNYFNSIRSHYNPWIALRLAVEGFLIMNGWWCVPEEERELTGF